MCEVEGMVEPMEDLQLTDGVAVRQSLVEGGDNYSAGGQFLQ